MNTYNPAKIFALILLILLFAALKSYSYIELDKELDPSSYILDQSGFSEFNYEMDEVIAEFIQEIQMSEVNVEIYDQNFNIIAFGNTTDTKINNLIQKSDLITKIGGKKYFRLSLRFE